MRKCSVSTVIQCRLGSPARTSRGTASSARRTSQPLRRRRTTEGTNISGSSILPGWRKAATRDLAGRAGPFLLQAGYRDGRKNRVGAYVNETTAAALGAAPDGVEPCLHCVEEPVVAGPEAHFE